MLQMYYPDATGKTHLHPLISPVSCKNFGRLIVFAITVADKLSATIIKK